MEEQIKDILRRRGALHIINNHRFYTEDSMKAALREALTVAKNNMETLNFENLVNMHSFKPKEILFNSNSLCGECGEVANVIKKMQFVETNPNWVSEGLPTKYELEIMLNEELSDALFYITRVALDNRSNLSQLMNIQANKLNKQSIKYNRTIIK